MSRLKNKDELLGRLRQKSGNGKPVDEHDYRFGANPGGLGMVHYLSPRAVGYITGHYGMKPGNLGAEDIEELRSRGIVTVVDTIIGEETENGSAVEYCARLVGLRRKGRRDLDETLMLYTLEDEEGVTSEEKLRDFVKIEGLTIIDFSNLDGDCTRIPVRSRRGKGVMIYTNPTNALYGIYRDELDGLESILDSHHGEHLISQFENAAY